MYFKNLLDTRYTVHFCSSGKAVLFQWHRTSVYNGLKNSFYYIWSFFSYRKICVDHTKVLQVFLTPSALSSKKVLILCFYFFFSRGLFLPVIKIHSKIDFLNATSCKTPSIIWNCDMQLLKIQSINPEFNEEYIQWNLVHIFFNRMYFELSIVGVYYSWVYWGWTFSWLILYSILSNNNKSINSKQNNSSEE